MAKSLSLDLRQRVITAIDGGLSCRQAAERFGASAASAIRWRSRQREACDFAPKQQCGDSRSRRIEAHAPFILNAVDTKSDITLAELLDKLKDHGVRASIASLWRFFQRRKITLKKRRLTPPSNDVAM